MTVGRASVTMTALMMQETYSLGAVYVDEAVAYGGSEASAQHRVEEVQSSVRSIDDSIPCHSALLEDAFAAEEQWGSSDGADKRHQTEELLSVSN